MSTNDERDVNPIEEMTRIAQDFLNLNTRGFKESYRSSSSGKIIFNSEWCRLSLIWGGWDYGGGNSISIRYGRLHAPDEKIKMLWNGEECRCWHRFEHAMHFLDGRTPEEAASLNYSHALTSPFYEENIRIKFNRRQPEWLAEMHITVWNYYGVKLFELFDMRRPDIWQQYRQFLVNVYDIAGRSPTIKPSWDKVC